MMSMKIYDWKVRQMKSSAQEYREATNKIEEQFHDENKKYFEELRSYLLFSSLLYDEASMNEQIYSIAQDLLEAQLNGESAIDFFGHHPKASADEILKHSKLSSWKERSQWVGIVVGITWAFAFISDFSNRGSVTVNPLKYLLLALLALLMLGGAFKLFKRSSFKTKKLSKTKEFLLVWLFCGVYIGLALIITFFSPNILSFIIPYPADLIVVSLVTLIVFIVVFSQKNRSFYPFSLMIIGLGSTGILNRYWYGNGLPQTTQFIVISLSIILISFLGYFIWMILHFREILKE